MKKVFALLTIVSVLSFVACKNNTTHDTAADSARIADSIKHVEDSIAAEKAKAEAEAAAAADTGVKDTGAVAPETK